MHSNLLKTVYTVAADRLSAISTAAVVAEWTGIYVLPADQIQLMTALNPVWSPVQLLLIQ